MNWESIQKKRKELQASDYSPAPKNGAGGQTAQSTRGRQSKMERTVSRIQAETGGQTAKQTKTPAKSAQITARARTVPVVQQSAAKNALDKRNYYQAPVQRGGGMKRSKPKEDSGFSAATLGKGMLYNGLTQAANGTISTLSWLQGLVGDALNMPELREVGIINDLKRISDQEVAAGQKKYAANVEAGGTPARVANFLGTTTVAAVPQAIEAIASAPAKGMQAVSTLAQAAPGLLSSIRTVVSGAAKNPAFWSSFLHTAGNDYDEAVADGADHKTASLYAVANGLLNAGIEVGGGLETMPTKFGVKEWVKAAVEEGNEEVAQGIVQRGLQNLVYRKENPLFSVTDENAVVNPLTAAQEWGGGAFAGAVLSGARGGTANILNQIAEDRVRPQMNQPGQLQEQPTRSVPVQAVQDQQTQTEDVLRETARDVVSSREAERVLRDPEALRSLEARTGQAITGSKSQQRQAVRAALEEQARRERGQVQETAPQTARVQEAPAAQNVQEQTAQAVQTRRAALAAADTFGENGAKAFRATAGQTNDPAGYYAGFAAYYQAGINGADRASVNSEYAGRLSEGQRFAAYSAGQNDAAVSLKREKIAAEFAPVDRSGIGLVPDDFVREAIESGRTYTDVDGKTRTYLTAETAEQVNQVAKSLGLRAQFVDSVFHGKANAKIEGDTVYIEKNNPNPVLFLMGHEATHRMQQLAPTEYRALRDMIANEEQDRIQARIAAYAEQGVDLTIETAMDEITADSVGRMMEDGSYLDEFIRNHRKDKSVLEKLRDAFRALVDKLTGKAKRQAQTAEGKLTAALEAAEKKAKKLGDGLEQAGVRMLEYKTGDDAGRLAKINSEESTRFSLKSVPPVKPMSDDWRPGATFDEVKAAHPTLFELAADEAEVRNPTQITGTVKSYRKIYDALQAENFDGTILDASSGLGYGTRAGREEYGFNVDDIEPFPDAKYQPNYTDYSTLDKTYDVIISNAVLNVIPQDLRDAMVVKIGEMLNPGGRAFINVRGTDVKNAGSKVAINDDLMEYFISNTGSYQKGFTSKELVSYLKDALGDGFTVEPTRKFGAVSAIVTRDDSRFSLKTGTETQTAAALHEEERLLREQTRELAQLQKENRTLTESRDYWKGQTQRTKQVTTDKKAVAKAARQLVDRYGAQLDGADITPKLQALYDYMASGTDGKDELTYSGVRERAEAIARTLVERAVETDDGLQRQYSDLRRYLRDTALVVTDQVKGDISDYGDFRKRNLGRMKLVNGTQTNIDQVYQELSYNWPEFFDEQIQSAPSDQLLQISMVLNDINRVTEYNPYQGDMQQATAGAANEIIETFFDLPQTKKTFADRAALRLEEAKAQGKIRLAEAKEQSAAKLAEQKAQSRAAQDRALLGEQMAGGQALAKQKRLSAERLQKVRDQNAEKLAQLREANSARVEQVIAKERQTRERQLEQLKERYQASEAKGRERRAARELRAKITRHVADLSRKLLKPTDQQHIPEVLRKPVAKLLESINLESAYTVGEDGKLTKGGEGDPVKRTRAFLALKDAYERIAAEDGSDIVFDPSLLGGADVQGSFSAVLSMGDKRLADMSREELEQVWRVVKAVEYSVSTAGKVLSQSKFAQTREWAEEFQRENQAKPRNRSKIGAEISLATPYTFFAQYGEAGHAIYRMLRDAQDRQQVMVNQVEERVKKLVDEKTVQRLGKETRTFHLSDGNTLTLTRPQMMDLFVLSRRKQALDHLLIGGVIQPEIKSKNIQRGTESLKLSQENLSEIADALTADEVKIAEGLQELASTQLAEYGNEASMRAYGYRKFTEKNYWPIRSAREVLHSSTEKNEGNVRSIKNIGMAKATRPKANNAVDVGDIFETFARHAGDMVDYAAWLCPMEDANRLFNFQFRDGDGNLTGKHMKGLLEQVGGKGAQSYWRNLMDDIQNGIGAPGDDPLTKGAERLVGSFKGAAVGANARVVIQQPTAFFRAGVVLDPQDMAKGLAKGVTAGNGWEKALQYSPIAMRKAAGGFDISAPATMKNTLFGGKTALQAISDKAGTLAGKADAWTWGRLWNACEWTVLRTNRALRPGSDAFYQEVARQFAEVIDQTQVVDGVLQRSNIMRSSNGLARQATSFMGEPIMSLNLLLRSYQELRNAGSPAARTAARKKLGRAALALTVTNVVNALAQSLIDAARDDDEDKKYWERFWAAFTGVTGDEKTTGEAVKNALLNGNLGQNLNPLTWIPFVKDAISLMQGYEVSRSDTEVISGLFSAGKTVVQNIGGKGRRTQPYAVKQMVAETARLFGVPVKNLTRDIWGLARSWAVETDNVAVQYEMEKAVYNIGYASNRGRYLDILYRALEQGDAASYQHIRSDLMERMELDGKDIDSGLKSRYEKAVEKDPDYTLPQDSRDLIGVRARAETETEPSFDAGQLSAGQYQGYAKDRGETYRTVLDTAAGYAAYDGLDDEDRNRLETAAWTYAEETALAANSGGKAPVSTKWVQNAQEAQKKYGIKPGTYALLKTQAGQLKGIKNAEGETITNSKGLRIMEVIYSTKGLNDRQRAAMAEYLGVGEKVRKLNRAAVEAKLDQLR